MEFEVYSLFSLLKYTQRFCLCILKYIIRLTSHVFRGHFIYPIHLCALLSKI